MIGVRRYGPRVITNKNIGKAYVKEARPQAPRRHVITDADEARYAKTLAKQERRAARNLAAVAKGAAKGFPGG
jgi:hypothetical protein